MLRDEFSHLLGLDHVDDPCQLMFPEARKDRPGYAAGDRRGLVELGRGACVPTL